MAPEPDHAVADNGRGDLPSGGERLEAGRGHRVCLAGFRAVAVRANRRIVFRFEDGDDAYPWSAALLCPCGHEANAVSIAASCSAFLRPRRDVVGRARQYLNRSLASHRLTVVP